MSKDDNKAFIFTLKNPHGVEPTRFMKRKESKYVIQCNPNYGPVFRDGDKDGSDMLIVSKCNEENSCEIHNDGTHGYECHPLYKQSLFVDKHTGPNEMNAFTVLDYEVYTHY